MPADQLLNALLQQYQHVHDAAETDRIVGTTTHLLSRLSNPLNLGVLTSQLLTAPALWHRQDGPRTALRIIGIYTAAASRVRAGATDDARRSWRGGLSCDEWARAVVKGADDDRSRPWQHLLVLTGALVGMQGQPGPCLSRGLRSALEQAVVTAANLALEHAARDGLLASASLVTALSFAFPLLSDSSRSRLSCSALLPILVRAITGEHGFGDACFLDSIASDTVEETPGLLGWLATAPSFRMLQDLEKQACVANLGPLSKLAAFAVQFARHSPAVLQAHDALLTFSGRLLDAWQRTALSDVDPDFERARLTPETLQTTWPLLWQLLTRLMFGCVAVLQAVVSRSLLDPNMRPNAVAPAIAAKSLHMLRNLFFISSRNGNNAFQVYTFSYLTSLDVISRDSAVSDGFLRQTRPADPAPFSASYLQRMLDMFHLNVAEHLPLSLSTTSCKYLIIDPAVAYLSHAGPMSPSGVDIFESAHSAILSVLSCPQHSALTIDMAPLYVVKLFESFPDHISARQFRIAFKAVMEIVSPPFPIAAMSPELSETLLETLRCRIPTASTALLSQRGGLPSQHQDVPLSEQSALVMALVDSLAFVPLPLVEEWLGITAQVMREIAEPSLRAPVRKRFLDVLGNGELDVERSLIGVAWWGSRGGREAVLLDEPAMMSGAIERSSRL